MTLITLIFTSFYSFSYVSCENKLKSIQWPLDCYLELELNKTPKTSKAYELLEDWCRLHHKTLSRQAPPEALFSLYQPQKCQEVAQKARAHYKKVQLVEGEFLNSFL